MNPRNLFDQVDFTLQVVRHEGGRKLKVVPLCDSSSSPSACRIRTTFARSMSIPSTRSNLAEPQPDHRPLRTAPAGVDRSGMKRPAGNFQDQLAGPPACPVGDFGVEPALEAEARRAEQAETRAKSAAPRSDRTGPLQPGPEWSCPRSRYRPPPSHRPARPAWCVGDHQHVRAQLVHLVVDRQRASRPSERTARPAGARPGGRGRTRAAAARIRTSRSSSRRQDC